MDGNEFIARVKRYAKANGMPVEFHSAHGKGSHGRLFLGGRFCTIKDRKKELAPGLLTAMLKQLGLTKDDI
ncbi:MAG: type II toxin-antitoxin system HicA family toxin [Magnetococcales bacterium]|nr:type II toxin-antitoxin system HicA family toxin [Magnetococcales bacterium]